MTDDSSPIPAQPAQAAAARPVPWADALAFALTVFVGAFLLFQVQPLVGKYILPWFGGTPGVWTTCLLFFQCLLLAGYAHAHWLCQQRPLARQVRLHLLMLGLAGLLMLVVLGAAAKGVRPMEWLKPSRVGADPTADILLLLLAGIGLPYLVLSATGPLIQAWFSSKHAGASPYRLYALSNVGSVLALVTYPFLVEPYLARNTQVWIWAVGMLVYVAVCGAVAMGLRRVMAHEAQAAPQTPAAPVGGARQLLWLLLPACGTAQLLATTNKICQDMAVIPFLWVLPLSLYLVSFIISFDSPRWYVRHWFSRALMLSWGGALWAMFKGVDMDIVFQVAVFNTALFVGCMVCHGELFRLRPPPAQLTRYYLSISAGGAAGGLFVALFAPRFFSSYLEFPVAMWSCGALLAAVVFSQKSRGQFTKWHVRFILAACWAGVCWAAYRSMVLPLPWLACARLLVVGCGVLWVCQMRRRRPPEEDSLVVLLGLALVSALASVLDFTFLTQLAGRPALHWAVTVGAVLILGALCFVWSAVRPWRGWSFPEWVPHVFVLAVLGGGLLTHLREEASDVSLQRRNFFGVIRLYDYNLEAVSTMKGIGARTLAASVSAGRLAAADAKGLVQLWDSLTGLRAGELKGHEGEVRAMSFSPDGKWLATGGADGTLRQWDAFSGMPKRIDRAPHEGSAIESLAYSRDGRWLASAGADGRVRLWDGLTGEPRGVLWKHQGGASSVAFSGTSDVVASVGADGVVRHGVPLATVQEFTAHRGKIHAVSFGASDELATAGEDGAVKLWHRAQGRLLQEWHAHRGPVRDVAFSGDGGRVGSVYADGAVAVWESSTGVELFTLRPSQANARRALFMPCDWWMPGTNTRTLDVVMTGGPDGVQAWEMDSHNRRLVNGGITHGFQYTNPAHRSLRTSYYGETSGVGLALRWANRDLNGTREGSNATAGCRFGVVGLGTGTLASYGKRGGSVRFYDINPQVVDFAEHRFSYLRQCRQAGAKVELELGDARLRMENEPPQRFDVLALDAFSSDAIPTHLCTLEAFEIYERHLAPGGIIAIHISNRHLDLEQVVMGIARALQKRSPDWKAVIVNGGKEDELGEERHWLYYSEWILLTRNASFVNHPDVQRASDSPKETKAPYPLWTDDYVSVYQILTLPHWWKR